MNQLQLIVCVCCCVIPLLSQAEETKPGDLLRKNGLIQWEISAGCLYPAKIAMAPARTFENENKTEILQLNAMSEKESSLQYTFHNNVTKVAWTLSWQAEKMQLTIQDGDLSLDYVQEQGKPCICKISEHTQQPEIITGDSLWHLALLYPETFDSILRPKLDLLRSGWNLASQVQELRSKVFESLLQPWQEDRKKWQQAVQELSHSQFARREAATQQLKQGGLPAILYLQNFATTAKTPEQQNRISQIINEGKPVRDKPDVIATGMVFDLPLWLEFLQSPQEETRKIALQHLSQLLERPLAFDIQASATQRQLAWNALKKSLLKK